MPAKTKSPKKVIIKTANEPSFRPTPEEAPVPSVDSNAPSAYEQHQETELVEESKLTRVNKVWFAVGGVVAVGVVVSTIVAAILYMKNPVVRQAETSTAASQTTPSPTPAFARRDITFEVFNGSGVAGAAGKAAAKLRDLGYTVLGTGNADEKVSTSVLALSSGAVPFQQHIVGDLSSLFGISSASGLLTGTTASARLTIGKQ